MAYVTDLRVRTSHIKSQLHMVEPTYYLSHFPNVPTLDLLKLLSKLKPIELDIVLSCVEPTTRGNLYQALRKTYQLEAIAKSIIKLAHIGWVQNLAYHVDADTFNLPSNPNLPMIRARFSKYRTAHPKE